MLVVRLASGWLSLVTVKLDTFGEVSKVLGVLSFPANRGVELDHLISIGVRNSTNKII